MSSPLLKPNPNESSVSVDRWMVVIFNNDTTAFDDVVLTLVIATGCEVEEARIEAWEAHTYGQAPVHFALEEECQRVAQVISAIGVRTEVRREWED